MTETEVSKTHDHNSADAFTLGKADVASKLEETGTMLGILGANPFRCRAFFAAARAIETLSGDLREMVETGELLDVKGIGKSIFADVKSLLETGSFALYDETRAQLPEGLMDMLRIQGMGPKKVRAVYEKLGLKTVGDLERAARAGELSGLPGFGEKTEQKILAGIDNLKKYQDRFWYNTALEHAEEILREILKHPGVKRHLLGGSLRRCRETIGDIDVLITTDDTEAIMDTFTTMPRVKSVVARGPTKSTIIYGKGISVDLRVVRDPEFAFASHYFTGSKDHNTAIRGRAKKLGYRLNEYGLFKGKKNTPCKDETALFKKLGLDYIPPELRENLGEIEAAEAHELPELVEAGDVKGVFHCHTNYSDGTATMAEMVAAARALGHKFFGIADHSRSAAYAGGLSAAQLEKQREEVDALNKTLKDFVVFHGVESDIHTDGTLDYPDDVLARLDYVIAAVHSNFGLSEADQTERIITAMKNPYTTMLAHPTGRLLLSREGYRVNLDAVIEAAAKYGVAIEINAHPSRLDLDWRYVKQARDKGVLIVINPDAHEPAGIGDFRYGVGIARKGWLTRKDVLNARTAAAVKKIFETRKRG